MSASWIVGWLAGWTFLLGCTRPPAPPATQPAVAAQTPDSQRPGGDTNAPAPITTTASRAGGDLWPSPTAGEPLALRYLPDGLPCLVIWHPAAMYACAGHDKIVRAWGADFAAITAAWQELTGLAWSDVDRLSLGLRPQDQGGPQPIVVAELAAPWQPPAWWSAASATTASFPDGLPGAASPASYRTLGSWSLYHETRNGESWLVVTQPADMAEALAAAETPPLVRRQMQHLLEVADSKRHLQMVAAPSFFYADGRPLFQGGRVNWPDQLHWLWGENLQAIYCGMHFDSYWYVEWRGIPQIDLPTTQYALTLAAKLQQIRPRLENHLQAQAIPASWQRLAERLPTMAQVFSDQTRLQATREQVQLNVALPLAAAHNLFLAADLLGSDVQRPLPPAVAAEPLPWEQILQTPMSWDVVQQSLEETLIDLARVVRTHHDRPSSNLPIRLDGAALQQEGITRNQQIRDFHRSDERLSAILTRLLMRANPVTTVRHSAEKDQKLVWYLDAARGEIVVSTRVGRNGTHIALPIEFTDPGAAITSSP